MSTIANIPAPSSDRRQVFRGVSWDVYDALSEARGEGDHVRLTYDGKDLEIMTTGNVHEHLKELLIHIIKAVASWLGIAHVACGQTTWQSEDAGRGLEADLSYYFDPEKIRTAIEALARESKDPADYPWPDLAIEIDISHPKVDRPSIYSALRVAEVWRLVKGRTLIIEQLQPDGSYAPAEASRFLPIRPDEVVGWLYAEDVGQEDAWYRRLNQWAMGLGGRSAAADPGAERNGA
jgi:Uma2 family endonuclease